MDSGAAFDRIARVWATRTRRRAILSVAGALLAIPPGRPLAARPDAARTRRRKRQQRKRHQRLESAARDAGCTGGGVACRADAECCRGRCELNGPCTRTRKTKTNTKKKKRRRKKKVVFTGACLCAPDACPGGACLTPPAQPSGLQAVALDASRIMLTWHDVSAEVGYRIHEGDSLVATVAADVTSYTVTGLAPNTYKCHAIQAFNSAGASPASAQACTTTTRSCGSHDQCRSNDVCQLGLCANGLCDVSPITCRVRTLVVIPSDVGNLPDDATVRNRTDAALNTISTYFETKLGSPLRYDPALILHAPFDSAWFSATAPLRDPHLPEPSIPRPVDEPWDHYDTALGVARERGASAAEARPAIDLGRMATYLANEGHGICDDGWLTQIVAATTLGGGFAGANICGSPLRLTANSGPADGPGYAGFSMVSQWVLEVILTGETSASCQEEMGNDYWACPAQVGLGTIVHELGHALGLPHPCDGWYRDHWEYTSSVCNGLIMQSHWNYPTAGFSANEQAILQLNPTLGSSSATLIAPAEQRAFATPAREKQRRRQRSQRRDSSE